MFYEQLKNEVCKVIDEAIDDLSKKVENMLEKILAKKVYPPSKRMFIKEVAAYLGVSVDTVKRLENDGKFYRKNKEDGRHIFYARKDIEAYLDDLLK